MRALYIILVPVVLLIILLNTGWLQSVLPAASVAGHSYTTVEYNFYYFDYYNAFLEEHEDELDTLGYDTNTAARSQDYNDEMTWQDFFLARAEEEMAECAYYHDLAEEAGYEFSDSDLTLYNEQTEHNQELIDTFGLKESNFYISYYGRGMTESKYNEMLKYKSEAYSYKEKLISLEETKISDDAISEYLSENNITDDYLSVNLSVITLSATPDRATESLTAAGLNALSEKLDALLNRYNGGTDFSELQSAYSDLQLGDESGDLANATKADLPDALTQIYLEKQEDFSEGDARCVTDDENGVGYFVVFNNFGASGAEAEASEVLAKENIENAAQDACESDYAVTRNPIGMSLATN